MNPPAPSAPVAGRESTPDELRLLETELRRYPQRTELPDALGRALDAKVRALLARGNLAQADVLALMALQYGVPAGQRFTAYRQKIAATLNIRADRPSTSVPRYLVIRAWGAGFWSEVDHLLSQLLLAEITGRQPIVHWGENCLYGGSRTQNGLAHYFELPGSSLAHLEATPDEIFPPKWSIGEMGGPDKNKNHGHFSRLSAVHLIGRHERIVVSDFFTQLLHLASWVPPWHPMHNQPLNALYTDLIGRYLRPLTAHQRAADQFVASTFNERPYLALHLRGLDKVGEVRNLAQGNQACLEQTDALLGSHPDLAIFLLTDDESLLDVAKRRYGARIVTTASRRAQGRTGLHFLTTPNPDDRLAHGREVMLDSLVALRANYLVGLAPSNLAAMLGRLRAWPEDTVFLLGKSQHEELNLALNEW